MQEASVFLFAEHCFVMEDATRRTVSAVLRLHLPFALGHLLFVVCISLSSIM